MPTRGTPIRDAVHQRPVILLLVVGDVGTGAILLTWPFAPGPLPLVAALVASVSATAVAVSRVASYTPPASTDRSSEPRGEQRTPPVLATRATESATPPPIQASEPSTDHSADHSPAPTAEHLDDPPRRSIPSSDTTEDDGPRAASGLAAPDEHAPDEHAPDEATASDETAGDNTAGDNTAGDNTAGDEPTEDLTTSATPIADDRSTDDDVAITSTSDSATTGTSHAFLSFDPTPGTLLDPADLGLVTTALSEDDAATVMPYVPRDLDAELDDALGGQLLAATGGFVVAQGPSASGLTRTMFEGLRRHAGRRPVLAVRPPTPALDRPLDALLAAVGDGDLTDLDRPIVLIDDAHRHLGRGLDRGLLLELSEALPGCAIVLTVSSVRLALPTITNDPTEDWLRSHIGALTLPDRLSDTELARAFERFPARSLDGRLRWLPAWCSGADERRGRFRDLRLTDPHQAGLLTAAAAWQLTTGSPAVSEPLLLRLAVPASGATATNDLAADPGDERRRAALHTVQAIGMLTRIGTLDAPTHAVRSELVDELAGEPGRITDGLWDALLDAVEPPQAALLARIAAAAGRDDVAARALTIAIDDPPGASRAAFELGVVLERLDRPEPAVEAYRRAVAGDDPRHAPMAAFHLGGVLESLDRTDDAADAYRWAIDSGHRDAAPLAAFNLGWLHEQQQRTEDAAAAYELAVASEHPDAVPMAAFNLGWLRQQQRRNREAEALYRTAAASSHDDIAPMAALHLGMLLERLQRTREARALFETIAAGNHTEAASAARLRLQTTRRATPGRRR